MPEILRLFDGPSDYTDWKNASAGYSLNDIEKIKDPASGTMKEVTSIPSPFARLHLFEHAFKTVTSEANTSLEKLDGISMYHKLVSDALDVGETLFNYHIYDKNPNFNLDIITWNKQKHLEVLLKSTYSSHKLLGETLQLYLSQDQEASNFNLMDNIHLIRCNYHLIGGTSPSTLYFAAYNDDFRLAKLGLKQGSNAFFDQRFNALFQRAPEFQRYLYALFFANRSLATEMDIFYNYLMVSLKRLQTINPALHYDILRMEANYSLQDFVQDYEELTAENVNDPIDIFTRIYHRKKKDTPAEGARSDFAIKADFPQAKIRGLTPLVLQNGFSKPLQYLNGSWNKEINVPYAPTEAPEDRFLPGQNEKYPYLTIGDFLEPRLIRLEFRLNKEAFFDGNPEGFSTGDKMNSIPPDSSYLLPIKPLYFQFFSAKTLQGRTLDGRPMFRMRKVSADSVVVELRIPINKDGEVVTFERTYQVGGNIDEANNKGSIVEYQLNLGLFPVALGRDPFIQHVGLIDNDILFNTQNNQYKLSFYKEGESVALNPAYETQKSDKHRHQRNASSLYYVMKEPYDIIVLDSGKARGIVLPKFKLLPSGNKKFTFAIDFGTSNTHIEYSIDGGKPVPFAISPDDIQLTTLMEPDAWYVGGVTKDLFVHEFIPELIGGNSAYGFPIRTATTEIDNLDHYNTPGVLSDVNICFVYEKLQILNNTHLQLNLKWQNYNPKAGPSAINRLRAFLGELLLLMRHKVLLNGGNLNSTQLIWFYPSSMTVNQRNAFSTIWRELFREYISASSSPTAYSEAEVPFYTYADHRVINHVAPVVNIDIGGGTTDIVIFEHNQPRLSTSVTFAGNIVWGEGYSKLPHQDNGFVTVFKPVVQRFLSANQNNGLYNLYKTFEQIVNSHDKGSEDLLSFFFSIDKNTEVHKRNLKFDLSGQIAQNADFKIIFVVFYSSIVYYTARLMKAVYLDMPRYLCLSGNGSKIIGLLDLDPKLRQSSKLSQAIFEKVYQQKYALEGLEIVQHPEPKEATCKGGILRQAHPAAEEYASISWLGDKPAAPDKPHTLVNNDERVKPLKYNALTSEMKKAVVDEYFDYLDMLIVWNEQVNFSNAFGVRTDKMNAYIHVLKRDALGFLEMGLSRRLEMSSEGDNIAETLFFYPLVGALYRLTQEIAQGNV